MKRILLIGDQPGAGNNTRDLLALSNFNVLTAQNPTEAGVVASKEPPDLLICDLAWPGADTEATLGSLQKEPALKLLPVIVFTDDADKANARRIMGSGADDYLVKPFEGIELLRAVDACLERQQRRLHPPHTAVPSQKPAPTSEAGRLWNPADRDIQCFRKKKILYGEGHRASKVWYIVDGKVKTFLVHPDGKELITGIHGSGDCVGYTAVLSCGTYSDNAEILEDAQLIGLSRREFLSILQSDSAFASRLFHWLAQSAGEREAGLLNFAYSSLRKKAANGILQLADNLHQQRGGIRCITISRENLAAFVGCAPESLTRTLGDFRKEGLIDIVDGHIRLLNEGKLRKMLN
jgi:CRP-like cAMP-binding protein/CheY-like chemotaxis protein